MSATRSTVHVKLTPAETRRRLLADYPGLTIVFRSMTQKESGRILRRLANPVTRQAGACELAMLSIMRFGVAARGIKRRGALS